MTNFKKRISISFLANCIRGGSILLTGILLARFLGTKDYGTLVFLMAASMAVKQLLDLGQSAAFFTFLSQEARSVKFIVQFWTFFIGKYIAIILVILLMLPRSWVSGIWLSDSSLIIIIAILATSMQYDFWPNASQLLESQRKTIYVQLIFIITQLIHFSCIFLLNYYEILTIINYLTCIGLLWLVSGISAATLYQPIQHSSNLPSKPILFSDYLKYCLPLVPVIFVALVAEFFDRWSLQKWGGANEQAYFAASIQLSSVSLLFTTSFLKIFWKEIAEALHHNNLQYALQLYTVTRKLFFYCAAFFAAAIIPWTAEIIKFLYGSDYLAASTPLIFIMVYSIYQSLGQLDSTFLMATGKTRIGLSINLFLAPIGFALSFILLSKSNYWPIGLELGATGLAIKMVVSQLISVNVIGRLIQRNFSIKFTHLDQIQVFSVFILLAVLIKVVLVALFHSNNYIFVFGVGLYALCCLCIALVTPRVIALPVNWVQLIKRHLVHSPTI